MEGTEIQKQGTLLSRALLWRCPIVEVSQDVAFNLALGTTVLPMGTALWLAFTSFGTQDHLRAQYAGWKLIGIYGACGALGILAVAIASALIMLVAIMIMDKFMDTHDRRDEGDGDDIGLGLWYCLCFMIASGILFGMNVIGRTFC